MTAESILEYWQLVHGPLSARHAESFLARSEVITLSALNDDAVRMAIDTYPKLADTVPLAKRMSPWFEGGPCEAHNRPRCARCHPQAVAAGLAEDTTWWFEGEPCEEDNLSFCRRCKPHPYPDTVVITRGWGYAFHRSEDCLWLHRGQGSVERRGGEPAPVECVAIQVAFGLGKVPCQHCFPSTGEAAA